MELKQNNTIGFDEILHKTDTIRKYANEQLAKTKKTSLAQFMTPTSVARFMASLFSYPTTENIILLDPGAGIGSLSSAFLANLEEWKHIQEVSIDAFEIDEIMIEYLQQNLFLYKKEIENINNIKIDYNIIPHDFIEISAENILNSSSLWKNNKKKYSHCIMNPPYKKINSNSSHRKQLRAIGIETVNLYSGFVSIAVELLEKDGEIVAIIPRSFCNGPYYKLFRKYILEKTVIRQIHLFDSRKHVFKDESILQENVIILLKKSNEKKNIIISESFDDNFTNMKLNEYSYDKIINPKDDNLFIHIPSEGHSYKLFESNRFNYSIYDLGLQVSTGPIVDFRTKENLLAYPEENSCPLIYPCHFSSMNIQWPRYDNKKPNSIKINEQTIKWLFPNEYYTLVRRFSSKEEKHRVVANVVSPEKFYNIEYLTFENHLNVFHINKHGLKKEIAVGLMIYLNSNLIDEMFRRFSGHTQVNATDLRILKYPSIDDLLIIGKWALSLKNITIEEIDRKLETMINE